jgi:hypothetical protein
LSKERGGKFLFFFASIFALLPMLNHLLRNLPELPLDSLAFDGAGLVMRLLTADFQVTLINLAWKLTLTHSRDNRAPGLVPVRAVVEPAFSRKCCQHRMIRA